MQGSFKLALLTSDLVGKLPSSFWVKQEGSNYVCVKLTRNIIWCNFVVADCGIDPSEFLFVTTGEMLPRDFPTVKFCCDSLAT